MKSFLTCKGLIITLALFIQVSWAMGQSTTNNALAKLAKPRIGVLTANPSEVFTNISSTVNFVCEIDDESVLPGSVTLHEFDARGKSVGEPLLMNRDEADSNYYSTQLYLNPDTPQALYFRVSAETADGSAPFYSGTLTLTVTSLDQSTWRTFQTKSAYSFQYPIGWRVSESGEKTISISKPDKAQKLRLNAAPQIMIIYEKNEHDLTTEEFFDGELGPNLFAGAAEISSIHIDAITATKLVGLESIPYDQVIVIPVKRAFLVIYSNAPEEMFDLFLTSLTFGERNEVEK